MKFESSSTLKKMMVLGSAALLVLLTGCSRDPEQAAFEYMPHMADSESVKAQEIGPDGIAMRNPVEGTVPQGFERYRFADNPDGAAQMKNPLKRTKKNLLHGQELFNTYCIVCHGDRGEGNGLIVPKFPQPPTLHSDKVTHWSDGRIFHVLAVGQNLMPSYASQISQRDRWAIIHYVRVLQRSLDPTNEDLRLLEQQGK